MKRQPGKLKPTLLAVTRAPNPLAAEPLFADVTPDHLAELASRTQLCHVPAGHIFFHPGGAGRQLFLLERGRVETYRTSGKKKLIIAELQPPAVFGEMGCLGPCLYHCSAQATEPSQVRVIAKSDLDTLQQAHPQVTRRLLDIVSNRFVNVLLDLDSSSFQHLIPRIARWLLSRAEQNRISNVTHRQLALHLRVYRESVTAALGELRKAGILSLERKQITILDRARLERASRE
jgi:CRP/FNR family transcriptional regulator, cyclic AMP receptor protein